MRQSEILKEIDKEANQGFQNKVKFTIMGEEFVSCSKKCKKVTKFAYMLKQNNEQEILRAFESMLRKKLKKSVSATITSTKQQHNATQTITDIRSQNRMIRS